MPEGDTVWRTANRLNKALAGEVLTIADIRWGEIDGSALVGRPTLEVVPRGKHILQRIEGGVTLHTHLRMEGQWRIAATESDEAARGLRNPDLRVAMGNDTWTALGLRLGMLDLIATSDESQLVGHLGPDVLGAEWRVSAAVENLRVAGDKDKDLALAASLLDQRNLAGVGTFWASEALFVLRLHPWQLVSETDDATLTKLVERAAVMISKGKERAIQSSTGELANGRTSFAHGRSGRPCRRCGGKIRIDMAGKPPQDRTIFWCPKCQGADND